MTLKEVFKRVYTCSVKGKGASVPGTEILQYVAPCLAMNAMKLNINVGFYFLAYCLLFLCSGSSTDGKEAPRMKTWRKSVRQG